MKKLVTTIAAAAVMTSAAAGDALRLVLDDGEVLVDLLDNPVAQRLAARLPLALRFEDFAGSEKISYLEKKLDVSGGVNAEEAEGDFCYYAPWGNLAVFYRGMGHNEELFVLGTIREGKALLARQRAPFTAHLEKVQPQR